jgi:RNA polymerase sigma-70 factor (ECF subfamily)
MHTTRLSLLQGLGNNDPAAWKEFDAVYRHLLSRWLRGYAPTRSDAEDLSQEIMLFVSQNLQQFEHNRHAGAFRKWLRACAVNIARNYLRKNQRGEKAEWVSLSVMLDELEQPGARASMAFDQACREALMAHLLKRMEIWFEAKTVEIFRLYALEELNIQEVMARCGVSEATVYTAKSRVMRRLRLECADWLADDLLP